MEVVGAGTGSVNGYYWAIANINGKLAWKKDGSVLADGLESIYYDNVNGYWIITNNVGNIMYQIAYTSPNPPYPSFPIGTVTTVSGANPVPYIGVLSPP